MVAFWGGRCGLSRQQLAPSSGTWQWHWRRDLMGLVTLKVTVKLWSVKDKVLRVCSTIGEVFEGDGPSNKAVTRSSRWQYY